MMGLPARAQDKTKVGFVFVGPIGDGGWTFEHNNGRLAVEAAFGDAVETVYAENVPEGPDAERVLTQMVLGGADLIFTTSFGYMESTMNVAAKFPDVKFEHATGYLRADNVSTYSARFYEGRAVQGHIAGNLTKSNKIGYIGSFPIPEVIRGINAFTLGVQSVNPDAQVRVVWTQTWFDPGVERDAADSLLDVGADVLTMHQDAPATLQAAEARGAYVIGYNSDMRGFAPNAFLTAPVWNWGPLYSKVAQEVKDGTWKSESIWWGMKEELVQLAPLSDKVPADVKALVAEKTAAIKAGTLHPFAGPIKDQDGKIQVAAGSIHDDDQLLGMSYFVKGVIGSPKG